MGYGSRTRFTDRAPGAAPRSSPLVVYTGHSHMARKRLALPSISDRRAHPHIIRMCRNGHGIICVRLKNEPWFFGWQPSYPSASARNADHRGPSAKTSRTAYCHTGPNLLNTLLQPERTFLHGEHRHTAKQCVPAINGPSLPRAPGPRRGSTFPRRPKISAPRWSGAQNRRQRQ